MYSGLSRKEFGKKFGSKENTVYQWECGRFAPKLPKLLAISQYYNVSLDSIVCGRTHGGSILEKRINSASAANPESFYKFEKDYTDQIMTQFNALSDIHKERLIGYLDALSKVEE